MSLPVPAAPAPEHNITGADFGDRRHFRYDGPIIDVHAHVFLTRPTDPAAGPPIGAGPGPGASAAAAETMLDAAADFGVTHTVTMCLPAEIPVFRERFGDRIGFNAWIAKRRADEPDDNVYRILDRFLGQGVQMLKFWAAPRGRAWGLRVDAPYRVEALRRARAAGVRTVMVHVADPDVLFRTAYADAQRFGTKADQYPALERLLELFPDMTWIAAHMGGDPEHPDHLQALLERYPHLCFDTSATKWQVREVSSRADAVRALICRHAQRFLFGVDSVTRHHLPREHYVSRYWSQRTLWESEWQGPSPIADADYSQGEAGAATPQLRGLHLPLPVLEQVYYRNALGILGQRN